MNYNTGHMSVYPDVIDAKKTIRDLDVSFLEIPSKTTMEKHQDHRIQTELMRIPLHPTTQRHIIPSHNQN